MRCVAAALAVCAAVLFWGFGHTLHRTTAQALSKGTGGLTRAGPVIPRIQKKRAAQRKPVALGPILPTSTIPGLFQDPAGGASGTFIYVTDFVVNEVANRTTVITFSKHAMMRGGNTECHADENVTFPAGQLEPRGMWQEPVNKTFPRRLGRPNHAGTGEWMRRWFEGHDCVQVQTVTLDMNVVQCIQITHCKGTHYGPTRGSLGSLPPPLGGSGAVAAAAVGNRGTSVALAGVRAIKPTAMPKLVEIVNYYELQGYRHVYIGVNGMEWSRNVQDLRGNLSAFVATGFVSIHICANEDIKQTKAKLPFLNAVLYHVKGRDDWLGVWDIDEIMVPRGFGHGMRPVTETLGSIVGKRKVGGVNAPCFITFMATSFTTPTNRNGTYNGKLYTQRLKNFGGRAAYEKSATNVNLAMFQGLHMPGSCSADQWTTAWRMPRESEFVRVENQTIAGINHYVNMLGGRFGNNATDARVPDEYSSWFFPLLKKLDFSWTVDCC